MSQQNADLMKSLYAAFGRGDVPTVLGAMDPAIVWNEAEGFPYADKNPYVGPQAVLEGVFMPGHLIAQGASLPPCLCITGHFSRRFSPGPGRLPRIRRGIFPACP